MTKTAIVLFNLGGPDGPDDVQPFLKNLFSDKAIIRSPAPVRFFLSRLISKSRAPSARENYARMGGGSPLLPETRKQADALDAELARRGHTAKSFIAMRYWKPYAADAVREVKAWGADRVILLPLYPQFSSTTTASSLKSWKDARGPEGVTVCCYPETEKFVAAHARKLIETWEAVCPRPAGSRRQSRRPLPMASRTHRRKTPPASPRRLGDRDLLPIARRPAQMDRPGHRRLHREGGEGRQGHPSLPYRLRLRTHRDAGRTRHRIPPPRRQPRREGLSPRARPRRRRRLHRNPRRPGRSRPNRNPRRHPLQLHRPHLPRELERLPEPPRRSGVLETPQLVIPETRSVIRDPFPNIDDA
jgi:hypothetical protein